MRENRGAGGKTRVAARPFLRGVCLSLIGTVVAQTTAWGAPLFGDSRSYPVGTSPVGLVTGEFSGEDGLDLASGDEGGTVTILANRGDGVFELGGLVAVNTSRFSVTGIVSGQFNADNITDFALSANDSQNFPAFGGAAVIYRSTQTLYRYSPVAVAIGLFPTCITLADATGDGLPDLVTCDAAADGSGQLSVIARNNDNTLANTSTAIPLGNIVPTRVVGADIDHDCRPDLLVLDASGSAIWILYGRASGAMFDAPVTLSPVDAPSAAVVGQFDQHGLPGIAVASRLDGKLLFFAQTSARTFAAPVPYPVGVLPADLAAADFDGDQTLDVVTANNGSNDVTLLLGNGDGTFRTGETVRVGLGPVAIVEGDFDGNGKPDFATANQNDETFGPDSQSVSVVLNGVSPPFTPTPTLTPSRTPRRSPTPTRTPTFNPNASVTPVRTPTPTRPPTPTFGPPAGPGDTNCDGKFSEADVSTVVDRIFDGTSGCISGSVSAKDITLTIEQVTSAH